MTPRLRVEGGAELAAALRSLSTRVSRRMLRDALEETIGVRVQRGMAVAAPRGPGQPDLADHIVIGAARDRDGGVAIAVGPSKETRSDQPKRTFDIQALFVEEGTVHRAATPFARVGFQRAPEGLGPLRQALWRELAGRGLHRPTTSVGSVTDGAFSAGTSGLGAGQFAYKVRSPR
jgi:hypothetical protein